MAYSNAAKWGKNSGVIEYWVTKYRGPKKVPVVSPKPVTQPVPTPKLMPHAWEVLDLPRAGQYGNSSLTIPAWLDGTLYVAAIVGGFVLSVGSFGLLSPAAAS